MSEPQTGQRDTAQLDWSRDGVEIVSGNGQLLGDANDERSASRIISAHNETRNELALASLQKEQNWQAYQEALRLLNETQAHAERLAEALKDVLSFLDQYVDMRDLNGRNLRTDFSGYELEAEQALAAWEGAQK